MKNSFRTWGVPIVAVIAFVIASPEPFYQFSRFSAAEGATNALAPDPASSSVSPMSYGAAGDGTTDDLTAVFNAATYAFDNGLPLDGGGYEYAVAGDIIVSNKMRPYVKRLNLKQLDPQTGRVTLSFNNCQQVQIDSLHIHVGALENHGSFETTFGLQVLGGSGHRVNSVNLTGNGKITYLHIYQCKDSTFENPYVHDGEFEDFEMAPEGHMVPDDVVQGIRVGDSTNVNLINPIVSNLLGNATYFTQSGFVPGNYGASTIKHFPNFRTRGICGGGNDGVTIVNPRVTNVEQGIDFSGNGGNWGNKNITIIGGHTLNCGSVGLKFAGAQTRNKIIGHVAENCGMFCYAIGGHSSLFKHTDAEYIGCTALNPGYNDIACDGGDPDSPAYIPALFAGFHVYEEHTGGIDGVRLVDCRTIDKQGFHLRGDDPWEAGNPTTSWPGAGATMAYLQFSWTGYTGEYQVTFNTSVYTEGAGPAPRSETKTVTLTAGSTTMTWSGGLTNAVGHPFVSRPALMRYGYMGNGSTGARIPFNQTSRRPNTLENCESIGHTIAHSEGFHRDICHVRASATQPTSNNTKVAVKFPLVVEDTMAMLSVEERVYPKRPGKYRVYGRVNYEASSGGYRAVEVIKNSSTATAAYKMPYATVSGEDTACLFDEELEFTQADIDGNSFITIEAEQTSGGAVNITPDRWLKVERVRAL